MGQRREKIFFHPDQLSVFSYVTQEHHSALNRPLLASKPGAMDLQHNLFIVGAQELSFFIQGIGVVYLTARAFMLTRWRFLGILDGAEGTSPFCPAISK